MRGGAPERGHQLSHERSEGEDKVTRAVVPRFRSWSVVELGTPRRPGRQRRKVMGGAGKIKRPATGSSIGEAQHQPDVSDSYDSEGPFNA